MVSDVIGEMLKLSMVVILVSVIAVSVNGVLPKERVPYIEVIVKCNESAPAVYTVNITHAGGDPVASIKIMINNGTETNTTDIESWRFPETISLHTTIMPPFEVSVVNARAVLARVKVN
jgi:FlaG/FlaF family flagellin (archaellin)